MKVIYSSKARQGIESELGLKINKIHAVLVSHLVVIMNLGLSAVLLLCFSKHASDAQSKVPAPFPCGSGSQIIPAEAQCDGYPDCPGGEDEHGCPPPLQEIQLTSSYQAEYQGGKVKKQQSAESPISYNWQGDINKNDAIRKHSSPSHQQSRHTFLSHKDGEYGMVVDYRQQQQAHGIYSSSKKGYFNNEWMHQQLNNGKPNQKRVTLKKNSVTGKSWKTISEDNIQQQQHHHILAINSGEKMKQQHIQSMKSATNMKQQHIQSMNSANNMKQQHIQSLKSANNMKQQHIQSMKFANNMRQHHIQAVNRYKVSHNDEKDLNLYKRIPIQRQKSFHASEESDAKYHHHDGVLYQQTQASGIEATSRDFKFPNIQATGQQITYGIKNNIKTEPLKYYSGVSQHITHGQHFDRTREGFQKPVAFKQDTDLSWAKDRWIISILVVLTCISMFSMIVQCWYCK